MMAAIRLWFATNPRNAVFIGALLAVLAVLLFVYFKGRSDEHAKAEAARAVEVQDAMASDAKADAKGEAIAQRHAEQAAEAKERLIDEVANIPDTAPDDVAVATACIELRHDSRVADLPVCRAAYARARAGTVR